MKKFNIMVLVGLGVGVLASGCEYYHEVPAEAQDGAVETEPQATADENIVTPPNNEAIRGLEDRINELTNRLNTTPPSREAEIQGLRDQITELRRALDEMNRRATPRTPETPPSTDRTEQCRAFFGGIESTPLQVREFVCCRDGGDVGTPVWNACVQEAADRRSEECRVALGGIETTPEQILDLRCCRDFGDVRTPEWTSCVENSAPGAGDHGASDEGLGAAREGTPDEQRCYGEQPRAMDSDQVDCCLKGYKYDTARWNACVEERRRASENGPSASENGPTLNVEMRGECALQEEDIFDECDVESLSVTFSLSGENVGSVDVSCSGSGDINTHHSLPVGGGPFSNVTYLGRWSGEEDSAEITCVFTAHGSTNPSTTITRRLTARCSDNDDEACSDDYDWTVLDLNGRQIFTYSD